jgi:hypothetical protein
MSRLLILTCLVAAPVPALAQPPPPDRDDPAIAAVEKAGGTASRDEHAPGRLVTAVHFFETIRDEDLDLIRAFPDLVSLYVRAGKISDAGLARLEGLPQLTSLHVGQSRVTGEGLAHLAKLPQLQRVSLFDCPVSDADLGPLEGMTQLRTLDLLNTNVTDAGVSRLRAALPYALIDHLEPGKADVDSRRSGGWSFLVGVAVVLGGLASLFVLCRRWQPLSRRRWAWRVAVVAGLVLVAEFALLWWAPEMAPVQEGDPATFWLHACKIDVGAKHPMQAWGGVYQPRDGWFIYYDQGMHGRFLYRVKEQDAAALFPAVVAKLVQAPPGALRPDVEAGARAWLHADPDRTDTLLLLGKLREAYLGRLRGVNQRAYEYALAEEDDFAERWERATRYHWNVIIEGNFFAALILFAAWPWLRGAGYLRWAVHLGLVPTLFFLPFWLGYARLSFTSAGPTGGALYPVLVAQFRGLLPWTSLDTKIVKSLPQVLEPLSQTTGPMLSLSGGGAVGPVAALIMSGGILLGIAALRIFVSRRSDLLSSLRARSAGRRSARVADEG